MWELNFIQNWSSSFQSIWRATKAGKIPVRSQLICSPRCFDSDCSWDLFSYEEAVTTAFIIYCKYNNSRKSGSAGEIKLCDKWFGFFPLTIMIWPELPQLRGWGGALGLLVIHAREREPKGDRETDEREMKQKTWQDVNLLWHMQVCFRLSRWGTAWFHSTPIPQSNNSRKITNTVFMRACYANVSIWWMVSLINEDLKQLDSDSKAVHSF